MKKNLITLIMTLALATACSRGEPDGSGAADSKAEETVSQQATVQPAADSLDADFPYSFEKVTDGVWVMHGPLEMPNPQNRGFMNNPAVVSTSSGLVIVDPGSTLHFGKYLLSQVAELSDQPIIAVFNTHIHGDHWLANQAIRQAHPEVPIYGHPEMIAMIEQGEGDNWVSIMSSMTEGASDGTGVVGPNRTVSNGDVIRIGDTQFRIHHYGVAHTKTDIMIEVVEKSTIFLGDNVLSKRLPRTSDGTFQGTIDSIRTILEQDAGTWVPGHGPTGDAEMVKEYLAYLELIYTAASEAFDEDMDSSDVIGITRESTAAYSDWSGYEEQLGPHGAQAFMEVEMAEF